LRPNSHLVVDAPESQVFRVHRSTMTSPEIFEQERRTIFDSNWLYIGHESEISLPGDYVRRKVAGRSMFLVRGAKSNEVRVFYNSCTHRGALVCRQDKGNSKVFQCFYHAWSFNSEGDLVGVPGIDAYGENFNKAELGLRSPARVESYRGFVFISFDPAVEDLVSYLAGAREYLDLIVDESDGEVEVLRGTHEYSIDANWKLLVENSIDGYHAAATHDTYLKFLVNMGTDLSTGVDGIGRSLGNGHSVIEYVAPWGRPIAKWEQLYGPDARKPMEELRASLVDRFGEERATRMADHNRNLFIYPNLVINDIMAVTVRTFMPDSADHMEVTAWELAPKNEAPDVRARRLDSFLTFLGPGGFATPDDVEALESCQAGCRSGGVEWSDISRGMNRDPLAHDEEQMRAFWRRWSEQVSSAKQVVPV
jgi:p-cumate 2,3-dioxygenase alpha subunit